MLARIPHQIVLHASFATVSTIFLIMFIESRTCPKITFRALVYSRQLIALTKLLVSSLGLAAQALFDDLTRHFQISRNADQIGMILANVLDTDFDFGLAADSLKVLRGNQDELLAKIAQSEVSPIRKFAKRKPCVCPPRDESTLPRSRRSVDTGRGHGYLLRLILSFAGCRWNG